MVHTSGPASFSVRIVTLRTYCIVNIAYTYVRLSFFILLLESGPDFSEFLQYHRCCSDPVSRKKIQICYLRSDVGGCLTVYWCIICVSAPLLTEHSTQFTAVRKCSLMIVENPFLYDLVHVPPQQTPLPRLLGPALATTAVCVQFHYGLVLG